MINKRLKDALFTDQWSELFMDALGPFNFVLVRTPTPSWDASGFLLPSLRALQGPYGWIFESKRRGSRKQRGRAVCGVSPNKPPPAGEHREDAGCHPSTVCQVLPSALPAGRADRLYPDWPGWLLGEHGNGLECGLQDPCLTLASLTLRRTPTQAPPIASPISLDRVPLSAPSLYPRCFFP